MLKFLQTSTVSLLILLSFSLYQIHGFGTTLEDEKATKKIGLNFKREKLSHFRVYWHDVVSGPSPTSVTVINPPSPKSPTKFGLMQMTDDRLTEGPDLNSKLLGRAQGVYASAGVLDISLFMAMNFAFVEGKYNGSTITVIGRDAVYDKVREMPIVGGSGLFRFARGYVQATTYNGNPKTGDAIVQYDCYVLHY